MHSHDFYEINITVNGEGMHYANHKSYKVSTGDVVVIPPEMYHGYHNGDKLNVFHVLVHRNYFNKYSGDLSVLSAFNLLFHVDPALRDSYTIPLFHIEGKIYEDILFLLQKLDELEQRRTRFPIARTTFSLIPFPLRSSSRSARNTRGSTLRLSRARKRRTISASFPFRNISIAISPKR